MRASAPRSSDATVSTAAMALALMTFSREASIALEF
jgi:hypothetical protein